MEFWTEFLRSGWGKEFIAGGLGGMAGVIAGHPLDTLRIRLQQPVIFGVPKISAFGFLRKIIRSEGASSLYRGMGAPLGSIAIQNAVVFQVYALLSRSLDSNHELPPSYRSVTLAGVGTGTIQTLLLSPVELVKIRLQLQPQANFRQGPISMAKSIIRTEGLRGIYRGLTITTLRDAPAHGVYFWTYEFTREHLHPGCRKQGKESLATMVLAGGLAGVTSWICCYPLDVVKSRLQAQSEKGGMKYHGVIDCIRKSVREEGHQVLFRGLGTAVGRAFVVNGAIFTAYEIGMRCLITDSSGGGMKIVLEET
ncbi:Mitochondrial carrier protein [Zostera marina]|uniref:Mitochondrial carrier protein n=1 Tax=Zostera marina TaxID=29655 RepID=A0A0K9PC13_ZOSMR|nr:Mitochondrial carrier protein [Zostera marina]